MSDFSYESPDERQYMRAVLLTLKQRGHIALHNKLQNAGCSIRATTDYSRHRWNAYATAITFSLPLDDFARNTFDDFEEEEILKKVCSDVMPADAGFDILSIDFSPNLGQATSKSLEDELSQMVGDLGRSASSFDLPADILDNGKKMAEVYLYLYAVENFLRLFIERVGSQEYGVDYMRNLAVPRSVRNSIDLRKNAEQKNQWLSLRGGSDLFYLDFKELGDTIINNWGIFGGHFPSQAWITSKVDELGNCRNLVAHNSLVGEHEINVIRTNFTSIVRQLNPFM